jgi:mRNA interferase MazF
MSYPHRGDVYWVNLDPVVGTEIAKTRPAVIISNDIGNEFSARVLVAPLTTGGQDRVYPFEVLVPAGEGGLPQASKVALDQIRTVDKRRLGRRIGTVPPERMHEVDQAIRRSLAV